MQIDTEHLHYWMCAIRDSEDPKFTLEAFWKGQIKSKEWLIQQARPFITKHSSIEIHGGWVGTLASLLFQSPIPIKHITSVDIDPKCESIAVMMNKGEEIIGKFKAMTADMTTLTDNPDVVINTSCEHISQEQYDTWLANRSDDTLLILQSNNYALPDHIRTVRNIEEFKTQCNVNVLWSGVLEFPLYNRFMIIGKKSQV
jgi:hypothetical protein